MPDLKTHDPQIITVTFLDRSLDIGRAEGEFVSTEYTKELYTMKTGADGQVTRVKSADRSAKIMVKTMQTSPTHRLLTAMYRASQQSTNGDDVGPFQIRDRNNGGMIESADQTWISKAPSTSLGADVGEREWELSCAELVREIEEG